MICCCCHESLHLNTLSCNHTICKDCMSRWIFTKWRSSCYNVTCPICRNRFDFSCSISKGKPIFKYDTISFTISALGLLEQVPSVRPWERAGKRLVRTSEACVLPILHLKNNTKVEERLQ